MKSEVRMLRGIFIGCRATGAIPAGNVLFGHATLMFWRGRVGGTHDGSAHPRGRRRVHHPWAPRLPVPLHRRPAPGCRADLGRGRGRRDEEAARLRLPGVLSLSDASAGYAHPAGGAGARRRARDSGTAADPRGCEILHELWSRSGARPLVLSKLRSAYRDVAWTPTMPLFQGTPHRRGTLVKSSDVSGFYKKSREDRWQIIRSFGDLTDAEIETIRNTGALKFDQVDRMIENVVGAMPIPLGIAVNFRINGRDYL